MVSGRKQWLFWGRGVGYSIKCGQTDHDPPVSQRKRWLNASRERAKIGKHGDASVEGSPIATPLYIQIVIAFGDYGCATTLGKQIAAQKRLKIAVEHLVHIAHFDLG